MIRLERHYRFRRDGKQEWRVISGDRGYIAPGPVKAIRFFLRTRKADRARGGAA